MRPRWDGFYVGAQAGYGFASMDFATSTRDLVAHIAARACARKRGAPLELAGARQVRHHRRRAIGGFVGYSIGWESLILGVELNYNRTNFSADAPVSPMTRVTSAGGNIYLLTLTGDASMHITDFATLRARAGYEVGNFLPFAMIGVAAGRADLRRSATVGRRTETVCPAPTPLSCTPFSFTESESKNGAFIFGWSFGGGLDIMLMPNIFLRGEYEYVAFSPVWDIKANIQTGRVGLGVKF